VRKAAKCRMGTDSNLHHLWSPDIFVGITEFFYFIVTCYSIRTSSWL